jgi:hypothetical protein
MFIYFKKKKKKKNFLLRIYAERFVPYDVVILPKIRREMIVLLVDLRTRLRSHVRVSSTDHGTSHQ